MKTKIHFLIYLLITLFSNNLFSQNSGWVIIQEVQYQQTLYEVQFVNNNTGFIGSSDSKLYKTTNAGLNWTMYEHINSYYRHDFNSIFFFDAQTGFIGGDDGRLFETTNGGVSIDTIIMPGLTDALHSVYFPSRDTGYIASKYGGIYKTINGGTNWVIQQEPYSTDFHFEGLHCINNDRVYATGNKFNTPYFQICRSTNGGVNWDGIKIDSADWIYNVHFTSPNTGFVVGERINWIPPNIHYYEGLIFKTTNGGNNWVLKLADSSSIFRSVYFINPNTGFVVGTAGSCFAKTTDGGESWSVYESYLFGGLWSVYFVNANTGIAVGGYRIIRTTNGGLPIGIKSIGIEIPKSFSLSQNYPNPFNPITKIKFEIPAVETTRRVVSTKIIIYDVLGKEVQTLVNENLSPGTYEASFNGSNLTSGVYYYQLTISNEQLAVIYSETKKMVLLK